ncbi:hypothetical protein N825_29860 [Skermanella stibiiresistens SB22]|uniref:TraK C-terminal domain-containing protein n=1 Tax=Skermanella stibiiresistens SB22 TaxID=1385369 RepID=W9GU51_9PROT|nr:type-F conjugative transfer system secretin TraK [Skermanella stibiiresistens]EWY36166.1 hypothetical protein N825_29860 [Skermanella stibiiresistens SB22]
MYKPLLVGILASALAAAPAAAAPPPVTAPVTLPAVPASVVEDLPPLAPPARSAATGLDAQVNRGSTVIVDPGANVIIPVSSGHLSRLITPFKRVRVVLSDERVTHQESAGVVYVGMPEVYDGASTGVATIYLTEAGDDSLAISLTLVGQQIPPREVRLELPAALQTVRTASTEAAIAFETDQPYVETVRTVLRGLALGKVPQGYSMRSVTSDDPRPGCRVPEPLQVEFGQGQIMAGHSFDVLVGTVRHTGASAAGTAEFDERWCATPSTVAVALWPHPVLEPGETSEIYVIQRRGERGPALSARPSLLEARR